mmetsp:Transcript_96300/g.272242  ORF Transcript_96300/g.272242 Transcript_96300/m.272242 type:complete len:292 (+) Transcript_96300:338-1213(+)
MEMAPVQLGLAVAPWALAPRTLPASQSVSSPELRRQRMQRSSEAEVERVSSRLGAAGAHEAYSVETGSSKNPTTRCRSSNWLSRCRMSPGQQPSALWTRPAAVLADEAWMGQSSFCLARALLLVGWYQRRPPRRSVVDLAMLMRAAAGIEATAAGPQGQRRPNRRHLRPSSHPHPRHHSPGGLQGRRRPHGGKPFFEESSAPTGNAWALWPSPSRPAQRPPSLQLPETKRVCLYLLRALRWRAAASASGRHRHQGRRHPIFHRTSPAATVRLRCRVVASKAPADHRQSVGR